MKEIAFKYFMVHDPNNRGPHKIHSTREEASEEAKRLARKHTGTLFFVLEAVNCFSVTTPEPTEIRIEHQPTANPE